MSLGINTEQSSGDFTPFVRYDARAGRWARRGDTEKGEQKLVDITNGFQAVFDLSAVETGWINFPTGAAPQYFMAPVGEMPPRPAGEGFKQGFRFNIALPASLGGGVYEVASTARAFIGAIDILHTEYENAPQRREGKLPVVAMTGTNMVETQTKKGVTRNYQPVLNIIAWVDRPASLVAKPAPAPAPAYTPPPSAAAPSPASAAADFG